MPQQLRVTRKIDVTGATKIGMGDYSLGKGKTYYVSNDGADGGPGTNPNHPLKTMTAAIGMCTNSIGDAIVVMQESPSTPTTGETWPIAIDKAGVLLTGLYSRGLISDSGFSSAGTSKDCINIDANFVSVENLYLQVVSGATTKSVVTTGLAGGSGVYGFTLRNCWLGLQTVSLYGFYTGPSQDWPYLLIEDCIFGAPSSSNYTSAIKMFNATFGVIRRNLFYPASSYIIDVNATCGNVSILDNKFKMVSAAAGMAIMMGVGSSDNFMDGNHAAFGSTTQTNKGFIDAGSDVNDWGINYEQEHATLPATS